MIPIKKPTDWNDKIAWCKYGEEVENYFVDVFCPEINMKGVRINPEKTTNKYAPDLLMRDDIADLKCCHVPFFLTGKKFGMPPEGTVSFDEKDYKRYMEKYPNILVAFWLDWEETTKYGVSVKETHALWVLHIQDIHKLIVNGDAKWFSLSGRAGHKGNSKGNYVIPLYMFPPNWKG